MDIYGRNVDQMMTMEAFREHAFKVAENHTLLDEVILGVASPDNIDRTFKVLHTIFTAYLQDHLFKNSG